MHAMNVKIQGVLHRFLRTDQQVQLDAASRERDQLLAEQGSVDSRYGVAACSPLIMFSRWLDLLPWA